MSNPMSLNRYSYVLGNPINLTDHSGMAPQAPRSYAPPNVVQTLQTAVQSIDPMATFKAIGQINGGCNTPSQAQVTSKFTIVAEARLYDNQIPLAGNIPINQLLSMYDIETDGASILSLKAQSVATFHREEGLGATLGGGWVVKNVYDTIKWGGVGLNSIQFEAHAEFAYKGLFDAGDENTFYTVIDDVTTIWANGVVDCNNTVRQTIRHIPDSYERKSCTKYVVQ